MNDRERFIACILGEPVDRPPIFLFWGHLGNYLVKMGKRRETILDHPFPDLYES